MWYTYYQQSINTILILKVLLYFSLIIGILRILGFVYGFNIPLLYGVFRYNPEASTQFGGIVYRFSGLDVCSYCGIFSLLALRNSDAKFSDLKTVIFFIIFIVFMFLHAGRASSIGLLFGLVYYSFFIEKIDIRKVLAGFSLIIILYGALHIFPNKIYEGQLSRIVAIEGGIQRQYTSRRGVVFKTFINEFYNHPVFGRGIKPVSLGRTNRNTEWIQHQLADGGHGSYHSLLGLFGLGGLFFIIIFLFVPIMKSHFLINYKIMPFKEVYIVIILFLLYKSLAFYAGGKGYNDYSLYMLTGIFAGINAKRYVAAKIDIISSRTKKQLQE